MADEEAEQDRSAQNGYSAAIEALRERLQKLATALKDSSESPEQSATQYCQAFCQTLVEYASRWRIEDDPLPLLEVYTVALLGYAHASSSLSSQCENVSLVLERLSLSCVELLLSLPDHVPESLWKEFRSSVQTAHSLLQENGVSQLHMLSVVANECGVWTNCTLQSILSNETPQEEKVHEFLALEGLTLLEMRIKHLIKENHTNKAALLAKTCSEFPEFDGKGHFKQMYLVCVCTVAAQEPLMEELSKVDCRDALEMICNLESDGDEKGAFTLCSAFLTHQLLEGDTYCAWELTLFWSKLLKRLESSEQSFLDRCRQMSLLSKTVFHILFFIKVIQSEMDKVGLPVCIEMCIRALKMESSDGNTKATICKTISCLLPTDLEVKRACQLTEFLLEPTVDSYYAVETLYNEPDQKLEEENLPVPNSLRCELLLVFKTQWPFDPEFWDWKTLKRHCLALMGEEASIVSSIDELNDGDNPEDPEEEDVGRVQDAFKDVTECFWDATNELKKISDERQKNRQVKKLREKGFISARFRNWQAYMQYCVLCDKEFLGHRIVRHAQTHFKDGYYSCPICTETFDTKETLEPHVASHVKLSCKERLAAMKTSKKLNNSKTATPVIATLKAESQDPKPKSKDSLNGDSMELYNGDAMESVQTEHAGIKTQLPEENFCPVPNCRKGFKYFRNLLAHVKDHGENEEARRFLEMQSKKVVCQYCRRQFVSVNHLNDHLQVHCGIKPYICIQLNCKASFNSNAELIVHRKGHALFKAKCMFPGCGKIFHEAYKLYDHEAQHYNTFTCKVPGCGKVFHTQSQLDVHQEGHVTNEEESPTTEGQTTQPVEQKPEHSNPVDQNHNDLDSPSEQVTQLNPLNSVPFKVKHSIENMLNSIAPGPTQEFEPCAIKTEPPDQKLFPLQQIPCLGGSVIRPPMNAHMSYPSQLGPEEPLTEPLMCDKMQSAPQGLMPSTSSYQSGIEDFQPAGLPDVLQGKVQTPASQNHVQSLHKDENDGCRQYTPDFIEPAQAHYQGLFENKMPPIGQPPPAMTAKLPSVSQALPPQATPRPAIAGSTNNVIQTASINNNALPEGGKERHHCAFETCTRNYSSYRSVTKHMKAAHPEFYVQWKLAKKNNKVPKAMKRCVSVNGNLNPVAPLHNQGNNRVPVPVGQMQTAVSQSPYPTACPSSNHTSIPTHKAALTSQTLPNQMENILNPILLSQLGNSTNPSAVMQSHIGPDSSWNSTPRNNPVHPQQTCCSPQVLTPSLEALSNHPYPSHMKTSTPGQRTDTHHREMGQPSLQSQETPTSRLMPSQPDGSQRLNGSTSGEGSHSISVPDFANVNPGVMPQMEASNRAIGHVDPSRQIIGSNIEGLLSSTMETVLPSYLDSLNSSVLSEQLDDYVQQTPDDSFSGFSSSERLVKIEMESKLPLQGSSSLQTRITTDSQDDPSNLRNDGENKRVKRKKRTKWPAIVKDGKFICCRCFREFQSPKSLGGHLSKRSHCKAFDETDLTADLPTSFLDLLNSPHIMNTPQPAPSSHFDSNTHFKDQPVQSQTRSPLDSRFFPNVTFPQANGSTYSNNGEQNGAIVKQIMDNPAIPDLFETSAVQQKFPNPCGSYAPDGRLLENTVIQHTGNVQVKTEPEQPRDDYIQSCDPMFGNNDFSDPLLSQLLAENTSAVSLDSLPTDHINQILRAETLMKMKEVKGKSEHSNLSGLSNDGLLAAMASLAQNLMTNPLLQITSPDPQQPSSRMSNSQVDTQKSKVEKNVKKRLREQILAGDLHRRSGSSQAPSVDNNASLRTSVALNPATCVSQLLGASQSSQTSQVIQMASHGEHGPEINNTGMASVSQTSMQSHSQPYKEPVQISEAHATKGLMNTNDKVTTPPPTSQEDGMMEIQKAFERLDLDREINQDTQIMDTCASMEPRSNDLIQNDTESINLNFEKEKGPDSFVKPFACDGDGCSYRAMTKDALFKHLTKNHNYTHEMLSKIKKNHGRYAPFCCQLCSKTFTRNSNLRAHCQTVHSLSQEEMVKLKIKRQYNRRVENGGGESAAPMQNITTVYNSIESPGQYSFSDGRQQQKDVTTVPDLLAAGGSIKSEYHTQPYVQQCAAGQAISDLLPQDGSLSVGMQPAQGIPMHNQATTQLSVIQSGHSLEGPCLVTAPGIDQQSNGQYVCLPTSPNQNSLGLPAEGLLPAGASSVAQAPSVSAQLETLQAGNPSPEKKPKVNKQRVAKPKVEKPKIETPKKAKEKKPEADDAFSPYRPYRCVHQGCVAAFTIQHNLILHYKAMHQSALPKFEVNNEDEQNHEEDDVESDKQDENTEKPDSEVIDVTEFRCQVKDCSRIFQEVTSLLQHYLQLHKFSLDKAGALISSINLGRFQCDQPGCSASFTAFWKYIGHIDTEHKETTLAKVEPVEGMFRCDVEGCDCSYTTRSNLLRHTMKKHHDLYKLQLMNQRKSEERGKAGQKKSQHSIIKASDGKENIENNKKIAQKGERKRNDTKNAKHHWTKYGKPSLKTKEEAAAMCTKKFSLQYPCMIKGCETVAGCERNIMKHYVGHGLAERYLEEQRSHFIYCKKFPRSRYRRHSARSDDTEKSEDSSMETSENEDTDPSESEYSKPASGKESTEDPELSDTKPSTDESSERSVASVVVKRKRGRPRKVVPRARAVARKRVTPKLRATRSYSTNYVDNGSDSTSSSTAPAQEEFTDQSELTSLSSFKPMGFEVSFLKFLEESNQSPKRKASKGTSGRISRKRKSTLQLKNATVLCKRSEAYVRTRDHIDFKNPQKMTSLSNVTFVVDKTFSDVADLLLKQLQEMRPTVILHK